MLLRRVASDRPPALCTVMQLSSDLRMIPTLQMRDDNVLVRIVLQDQLLKPQECPLVRDFLPDLHTRLPRVLCRQLGTCRALTSVYDQCQDEGLLQHGIGEHLLLNRHIELDSSRMRFSPDEGGVDESDFL